MVLQTAEQVAQRAFDLGLLDERQLRALWSSFGSHDITVEDFLQILVRREYLTNYQVERLIRGEKTGFFFGNYRVLYLVGSGTFARVYRAAHRDNGNIVALKVLRNRFSENRTQANLFVREGRVGCTLRHPNIVPIYEVVSEGKTHFLVMEFVEGRNLREFVRVRKKLSPLEATRIMLGITDGLRYAFDKGLTHRDLKMSNVLVSSRGEAKLVDFGLASMDETLSEEALSDLPNTRTVDYAALERATGVRKDDVRSDIYFLGCIYYHMLTGKPPLPETRDRLLRLSKQRFLDVVPIHKADPTLPTHVTVVVNKAMSLDPTRRYQTPAAMLADLQLAAKRLANEENTPEWATDSTDSSSGEVQPTLAEAASPGQTFSVLVVEGDQRMQHVFRKGFAQAAGFQLLLADDPKEITTLLRENSGIVDFIVLSTQQLGHKAVEAFNRLGQEPTTSRLPAVLLVDEGRTELKTLADCAGRHRAVLSMPITMRQLLTVFEQLRSAGGDSPAP